MHFKLYLNLLFFSHFNSTHKNKNYIIAGLFSIIALVSCEKNAVQELPTVSLGAQVKFFNFSPSSPSVNFFANTAKISGTLTATGIVSTNGVNYGSVFPASNYASIAAGSYAFKGQIPETATADANLAISNLQTTIAIGKKYSFYTSGIYNSTTKTTDAFIIEDVIPAADTSSAYVRIVNTISNTGISGFDLKAVNTTTLATVVIADPIAYKSASAFVKVPNGIYNLTAISANTSTSYTITRAAVSFTKGFVYTISTKGDATLFTGTNVIAFDLTTNR